MGYPMARNLLRAGHEVALWSHTAAKARELAEAEKGMACGTPKEVAQNADCIFLCVGDTEMSEEVILGANGIVEAPSPGRWSPTPAPLLPVSRRIGEELTKKGIHFLDAPAPVRSPEPRAEP